jgi:predicted alpha-1,2-mannosidase
MMVLCCSQEGDRDMPKHDRSVVDRVFAFAVRCGGLATLALLLGSLGPARAEDAKHPYADSVYPFLGADWGGNVFVGSAVPFGMVKLGPDMEDFDRRPSPFGYASAGRILGFSHLHLSGASGKYGNILVAPVTGPLAPADIRSGRTDESAGVGYYGATLTRYQVKAELTSTRRVGFHRYVFPESKDAHITLDLEHCLNKGTGSESQKFLGGEIHILSNTEIEGVGRYIGGWNNGGEYKVYFHLVTDRPARSSETWTGSGVSSAAQASVAADQPFGAAFDYDTTAGAAVQVKVGISFVSADQARHSIETESPGWNFAAIHEQAVAEWDQALSRIKPSDATPLQREQLYTALYHTMLMPSDRSGENPGWQSTEPYYDDYYTIWDTFRSSGPLLTLIAPDRQRDLVRSAIDIYRHDGYLPDGRSGNSNGRTQGGSNADVMIADAYVKGLTGIDYDTGFAAMRKNAEVPPADPQKEGRGGLAEYNEKGYVSLANERSGSRTVEYAYDDFAIAELACGLNHPAEAKLYASRAGNWANLWDETLTQEGVKGFLRPKNVDGSWAEPNLLKRGTWPDFFYEGDLWTYSLYAPQDVRRLIALSGGNKAFVQRLDRLFYGRHFDLSNEPGFLIPMFYDWAGRPDKAVDIITLALEREFLVSRGGIPGNDDSGAMSSWLTFQLLGIYPNAGQDIYLIGTPSFTESEIELAGGKVFRITARNLDREHVNRYVQSATLNGAALDAPWFRHSQIKDGGTLVLTMGSEPLGWGTAAPPPSMSDPHSPLCAAAQP